MCRIHTLAISIIAFENKSSNHYSITLSFVYKKKKLSDLIILLGGSQQKALFFDVDETTSILEVMELEK